MLQSNLQHIHKVGAILRPFLTAKEGVRLKAYLDPVNIPTIGRGITSYHFVPSIARKFGRNKVKIGDVITPAEDIALFDAAIAQSAKQVAGVLTVPVNPNQLAALASLVYNWGIGNFRKSQLLAAINAKKPQKVISQIFERTAITADGIKLKGLITRRDKEEDIYTAFYKTGSTLLIVALFLLILFYQ